MKYIIRWYLKSLNKVNQAFICLVSGESLNEVNQALFAVPVVQLRGRFARQGWVEAA